MKRRQFISQLSSACGLLYFSPTLFSQSLSHKKLKVLVLGGTNFLGPAIVNALVQKGHEVSLFNRGFTNPSLFPDLTKFRGDREKGLLGYKELQSDSTSWDTVIDVWPENPTYVEDAIKTIGDRTRHYMFVSSIAVYNNYSMIGMDETAPIREATTYEDGNYNANKVLCEAVVKKYFPMNHTIVRPGAIVGHRDPGPFGTDVLRRIMEREQIMAPNSNDPVQFIDAKDIGDFLTRCASADIFGVFNLVGPKDPMGYKEWLNQCVQALDSEVEIIWIEPYFLINEMNVEPFMQIPFWIPLATDPEPGFYQLSARKALDKGLKISEFRETVKRSYLSFRDKKYIAEPESEAAFGISAAQEDEIISRWMNRK